MESPVVAADTIEAEHSNVLVNNLQEFRRDGFLSDCRLVVDEQVGGIKAGAPFGRRTIEYPVHKLVLAARSSFFRRLLSKKSDEPVTIIRISDCSTQTMESLLHYLYTGQLILDNNSQLDELNALAEHCEITDLTEKLHTIAESSEPMRSALLHEHQQIPFLTSTTLPSATGRTVMQNVAAGIRQEHLVGGHYEHQRLTLPAKSCLNHAIIGCIICDTESRLASTPPATIERSASAFRVLTEVAARAAHSILEAQQVDIERQRQQYIEITLAQQQMRASTEQQRLQQQLQNQLLRQTALRIATENQQPAAPAFNVHNGKFLLNGNSSHVITPTPPQQVDLLNLLVMNRSPIMNTDTAQVASYSANTGVSLRSEGASERGSVIAATEHAQESLAPPRQEKFGSYASA